MRALIALLTFALATSAMAAEFATVEVKPADIPNQYFTNGMVESLQTSTVSAQVAGEIKTLAFDVNDHVKKGDIILTMDDSRLQAQLKQAEAAHKIAIADNQRAVSEYQRYQALSKASYVSEEQVVRHKNLLDVSAARVEKTAAHIREVKKNLSFTVLRAPYTGVLTKRFVEVGESVNIGQPLLTGRMPTAKRAVFDLPISVADTLSTDSVIDIHYQNKTIKVSNLTIFPNVNTDSQTITVRAMLPANTPHLRPGRLIRATIPQGSHKGILIDQQSLYRTGDISQVWVMIGGHTVIRPVTTGQVIDHQIEITSGLSAGDHIVLTAKAALAGAHK